MTPIGVRDVAKSWRFSALVANGCGQALAAAAGALCIRDLFDQVVRHWRAPHIEAIWTAAALFLLAGLMGAALKARERVDSELLGFDFTNNIRMRLFDHLAELAPRTLERRSEGVILLRFVGDLTALKLWVSEGLAKLTVATVTTLCTLTVLAFLSPVIALAAAASLIAGGLFVLALSLPLERAVRASRKDRGNLAGHLAERIIAMRTIQSLGSVDTEHEKVARRADKLRGSILERASIAGVLRGASHGATIVSHLAVLAAGAYAVTRGQTTPGMVIASLSLITLLSPYLNDLGHMFELRQSALVCREKVDQLMTAGPVVREAAEAQPLIFQNGRVEFERVSVSGVFDNLSLAAPGGSVIAITGANGAGKSTLLALASRLIEPIEGRVLIDGQDIAHVTRSSLRPAVGVVGGDLPLLRGSVDMNLRYRCPDASTNEVNRIAAFCGIEHLLQAEPDGKPQRLRDRGRNLSLGERQRLLLARALLGTPGILLLDEVEANLDELVSNRISTLLENYPGTVLMVTHRPSWIRKADYIWRIEPGRGVEVINQTQNLIASFSKRSPMQELG